MSGQNLMLQLRDLQNRLNTSLGEFAKYGQEYAIKDNAYRVAYAKEILIERGNGLPVTILADVCRGKVDIAKRRMQRDVAETMYKSAGEHIQALKLQIRVLEGQIEREYRG